MLASVIFVSLLRTDQSSYFTLMGLTTRVFPFLTRLIVRTYIALHLRLLRLPKATPQKRGVKGNPKTTYPGISVCSPDILLFRTQHLFYKSLREHRHSGAIGLSLKSVLTTFSSRADAIRQRSSPKSQVMFASVFS